MNSTDAYIREIIKDSSVECLHAEAEIRTIGRINKCPIRRSQIYSEVKNSVLLILLRESLKFTP